jgi:hypothetical protein
MIKKVIKFIKKNPITVGLEKDRRGKLEKILNKARGKGGWIKFRIKF